VAVEFYTWNVRDAFGDPERTTQVTEKVLQAAPDIAYFAEAYKPGEAALELVRRSLHRFYVEGYTCLYTDYQDDDGRADTHGAYMIARQHIVRSMDRLDLGTRTSVQGAFTDPESGDDFNGYGVHFDDRTEQRRRGQADMLLKHHADNGGPAVVFGDFNSLHSDDPRARKLRKARSFVNLLPVIDPGEYHALSGAAKLAKAPARIGSLGSRLVDMADGGTVRAFKDAVFIDADKQRQPTKGSYQLDRIMATHEFVVENGVTVYEADDLSDHDAISARLSFLQQSASSCCR
jgi:endonuclease/exonuclease/phosphatase family metal-dependent hydrolase